MLYTYRGYQDIDFIKNFFFWKIVLKKLWINIIYINILLVLII